MSLLTATGALAQPPGNRPPSMFADFGDLDVMGASTVTLGQLPIAAIEEMAITKSRVTVTKSGTPTTPGRVNQLTNTMTMTVHYPCETY
jgi:hypothetical protein